MAERARELNYRPRGIVYAPRADGEIDGRRFAPSAKLAPFVHHYWCVRWALRSPFTPDTLPHPVARIEIEENDGALRTEVSGVHTGRVSRSLTKRGQTFGITFRAAMFQPLLRTPMTTITDRAIPLRRVFGPAADAWARAVLAARDVEAKVSIVEAFLQARVPSPDPKLVILRDLVERMATDRSLLRVEDAADALGVDVRALQRRFRRYVGATPKWVIQRFRLHEAAEQLRQTHPPSLAELAASLGYADQAHFARDFKLVMGRTPKGFLR